MNKLVNQDLIEHIGIEIKETELSKKITIGKKTETRPVYKVPLNFLYFNDKNDRIATFVDNYKDNNNISNFDFYNLEKYNEIIHEFIKDSKIDAFRKTKKNIEAIDQKEAGIVLKDGRIIDGNRRFCCLRELNDEHPDQERFQYFETIILDYNFENYEKDIKMLELKVQLGEDGKVDYNPIDKLFGLYNDIEKTKLLTISEYAKSTNLSEKDVEDELKAAKLIAEFLNFINCNEKFYIAKELQLDGPIKELRNILKNFNKDKVKKEKIKNSIFTSLLLRPSGDMTREIRNYSKILKSHDYSDEFLDISDEFSSKLLDSLPKIMDLDMVKKIKDNNQIPSNLKEIRENLKKSVNLTLEKISYKETRDKPSDLLQKSLNSIESINFDVIQRLNVIEKKEINNLCEKILLLLDKIKKETDI